jgi:hypothetical protein
MVLKGNIKFGLLEIGTEIMYLKVVAGCSEIIRHEISGFVKEVQEFVEHLSDYEVSKKIL